MAAAGIALHNRLFSRSIVTRRRGVGGVFLPWGNGLNCEVSLYYVKLKFTLVFL